MSLPRLPAISPDALAVGILLLVMAGLFLLRRVWLRLLGPVFVFEADRAARRGRTFAVRVAYLSVLLGILYFTHPRVDVIAILPPVVEDEDASATPTAGPPQKTPDTLPKLLSRFAADFSNAFLIAQAAVVLLLTPMYVGGAISDEKENGSLDFLLVTRMSDLEILLGKLGSRLLNVFGILMVALPVLAATLVWGGIDLPRVIAGLVVTAITAVSVGCVSLMCSVLTRRTYRAIFGSYVLTILHFVPWLATRFRALSNPISFQITLNERLDSLRGNEGFLNETLQLAVQYLSFHLFVALVAFSVAAVQFRRCAQRGLLAWIGELRSTRDLGWLLDKIRPATRILRTWFASPPVGDRPLLWKERYVGRGVAGGTFDGVAWLGFVVIAIALAVLAGGALDAGHWQLYASLAQGFQAVIALAGVGLMIGVGLLAAGSVTREREQSTLESLLATPVPRGDILAAKWLGAVLRMRRYLLGLPFVLVVGFVFADVPFPAVIVLPCVVALHVTCVANLGLFLSTVYRSTARASVTLAVVLLAVIAGTWALQLFVTPVVDHDDLDLSQASVEDIRKSSPSFGWSGVLADSLNPIQTWRRVLNGAEAPETKASQAGRPADPIGERIARNVLRVDPYFNRTGLPLLFTFVIYGSAAASLRGAAGWRFHHISRQA